MSDIYIFYKNNHLEEKAKKISKLLDMPHTSIIPDHYLYLIYVDEEGSQLQDVEGRKLKIDFDKNKMDYFRKTKSKKKELLSKALGEGARQGKVLDLSCGLGIDTVFMSQLGYNVIALERNPIVHFLLTEAFARTKRSDLNKINVYNEDAISFLKNNRELYKGDVKAIYFDPMYPSSKKSALPRQEMIIFRSLVGEDMDAMEVAQEAMNWPNVRVVIKRPLDAEPLLSKRVHFYEGKSVRFDMYHSYTHSTK